MSDYNAIVDWFSFTLQGVDGLGPRALMTNIMGNLYDKGVPSFLTFKEAFGSLSTAKPTSRKPYKSALRFPVHGIVVAWGGHDNVCIDVSGAGCRLMHARGELHSLIGIFASRASRIDLALDIPDGDVDKLADIAEGGRKRATGAIDSDTGYTRYIGSAKSERMLRVYRYNEPHPRADMARIEFVYRKALAKAVAAAIVTEGVPALMAKDVDRYGLGYVLPDVARASQLPAPPSSQKTAAGTLRWLSGPVRSALWRLHDEGVIDVSDFIRDVLSVRP